MDKNKGFKLVFTRPEGSPIHPDDSCWDSSYAMSDKFYLAQLKAYARWHGVESTKKLGCLRSHFLDEIGAD